jgi:hypothetical protein
VQECNLGTGRTIDGVVTCRSKRHNAAYSTVMSTGLRWSEDDGNMLETVVRVHTTSDEYRVAAV